MRITLTAGLFVAAATVALAAQTTPTRQTATTSEPPTTNAKAGAVPVRVTGCLVAGPEKDAFTLTTTATLPASSSSQAASQGSRKPKPSVATMTYALTAAGDVDLKSHAGQTVEVVGTEPPRQTTVIATDRSARSADRASGTSGEAPKVKTTAKAEIVARHLSVTALRVVAPDCRIGK